MTGRIFHAILAVKLALHMAERYGANYGEGGVRVKNRVRELREEKGLTQGQLAEVACVSRQTINAIETGRYDPSIWLAHTLSKVFGAAIEEIFIFEEGENDG